GAELVPEDRQHVSVALDREHPRPCSQKSAGERAETGPELHGELVRARSERLHDAFDGRARDEEVLAERALGGEPMTPHDAARILPLRRAAHAARRVALPARATTRPGRSAPVARRRGTPSGTRLARASSIRRCSARA